MLTTLVGMRDRSGLWRRLDATLLDPAIAGLLLVIPVFSGIFGYGIEWALDSALIAPLVLRRRAPVLSFAIICTGLFLQTLAMPSMRYGDFALLFALYAIAAYGPRWAVWAGLGVGFLGVATAAWTWTPNVDDPQTMFSLALLLGASVFAFWLLGYLARTRRAYVASLEQRAAQLEREASQQTQIAAAAERARIAREMHDVVAHSLSVIVVQADGGLYAAQKRPEQAVETLRTVSSTGRASLAEMRKLLGVLRDDQADVDLAPVPGAADVPALVDTLRGSGLPVELHVGGRLDDLDAATGLTVYRVVQEALTNTLKHAGPDVHASVDVQVDAADVRITVDDDGRGTTVADGGGHGIVGIRERIAVHAGSVDAGPRPGGGFRVCAVIPVAAS